MAKTIKELEDSIETKEKAATKKGGGREEVYKTFRESLTLEEFKHHEENMSKEDETPKERTERIANRNRIDNYYDNISYIASAMAPVKFVAVVTIIIWAISVIGFFVFFGSIYSFIQ